jgi:two-component system, NtrC family, response regulator HydG
MLHPTTLLVTQDTALANAVSGVVRSIKGFLLAVVPDIETACIEILEKDEIVVTLVHLDGMTNVAGLTRVLQMYVPDRPPMVTIVISEHAHPEQALIFSRLGVAECMSRPLDLGRLSYLIDVLTIETRYGLTPRPRIVEPDLGEVRSLGDNPPFFFLPAGRMGRAIEQIKRIAPLDTTVMIGGETGTGKTQMAGLIHRLSPRRDQPFLTINCGALAASLIESEMFGHARGAFTGADAEHTGKFAAVGRGTLFLDEIDSLPSELQTKLLRVVEERAFEAVGSNKTLRLRARLIVASNRPLEREVALGRFRSDLFYRLNVVAFDIPPLRDRIGIIPALASTLLAGHAARDDRRVEGIAPAAMQALLAYDWPGNVREFRNVIERAVALGNGPMIELDDFPECVRTAVAAVAVMGAPAPLPPPARSPPDSLPALAVSGAALDVDLRADHGLPTAVRATFAESKDQTERALIVQALDRNDDNRLRAAADLGISRMTLYKKLHKYGLMGA